MPLPPSHPEQDRQAGLGKEVSGDRRVTKYSDDTALQICERIAQGETLRSICQDEGMPSLSTFQRWTINKPKLARAYAAARELSAYSLEEEALDIARRLSIPTSDFTSTKIRAYDVAITQMRWSASRRNPQTFSERGAVQITVPIQINTPLDMGHDQGAIDHPDIYQLEAKMEAPDVPRMEDKELMQQGDQDLSEPRPVGVNDPAKRRAKIRERMDRKGAQYDAEHKAAKSKV